MPHLPARHQTLAFILALAFAGPAAAQADDTEARLAAARQVVALTNEYAGPDRVIAAMKAGMQQPLEQRLRSATHLTMAQRERAVEVLTSALSDGLGEMMAKLLPELNAAMTRVYVERFTLAEIEAVRRFYDSPAGRKSMEVMAQDMPQLMQPIMQGLHAEMPKIHARAEAALQRLAAEGIVMQPPPMR